MSCIITQYNIYSIPCTGSVTSAQFDTFLSMVIVMQALTNSGIDPTDQFTLYPIDSTFAWLKLINGQLNVISPGDTYDDYLKAMNGKFQINTIKAFNMPPPSTLVNCPDCVTLNSSSQWLIQSLNLYFINLNLPNLILMNDVENVDALWYEWTSTHIGVYSEKVGTMTIYPVSTNVLTMLQEIFPNVVINTS